MGKILSQEMGIWPSSMVDPTIFSQFKKILFLFVIVYYYQKITKKVKFTFEPFSRGEINNS